jgi:hypothetical protein
MIILHRVIGPILVCPLIGPFIGGRQVQEAGVGVYRLGEGAETLVLAVDVPMMCTVTRHTTFAT